MTKIIANLNSKTLVRDKEIDLQTRVVVDILTYAYSKFYYAVLYKTLQIYKIPFNTTRNKCTLTFTISR